MLDPMRLRNAMDQLWLNVASSTCVEREFVNFDNHVLMSLSRLPEIADSALPSKYRPLVRTYRDIRKQTHLVRHDCRKPLPLPTGSADHILCSHFLEHVHPDEAVTILRDFGRVLKPGGTLHVIVPDLSLQVAAYLRDRQLGIPTAADELVRKTLLSTPTRGSKIFRILEAMGQFGLTHRWMYDDASMAQMMEGAGFVVECDLATPSDHVRAEDGISVHVKGRNRTTAVRSASTFSVGGGPASPGYQSESNFGRRHAHSDGTLERGSY